MIYTEIGVGNDTFVSTEVEVDKEDEYRIRGFMPMKVRSVYIRIGVGTKVIVLDTKDGLKFMNKNRKKFKLLLGVAGYAK